MPALSVAERAAFDETRYPSVGYIYISQPEIIFEAPLVGGFYRAGAVVALDYGTPTTGAYTDIQPEMTLELWDSTHNAYGSQRIRQAATASAIYVGRSSQGNKRGELQIADGATIRVYKERRGWSKISHINKKGKQRKDELKFPGSNAAQPPVANAGPNVLIIVPEGTASAIIPLDALGDVPSFAVRSGASLSGYLWDLDDGSVDTGSLSSSSLTASFPLGERDVSLTVSDSNGVTHTAYKFVVVATPNQCIPVEIADEIIRPTGVSWSFKVDLADVPVGLREGTRVVYTQHDDYALAQVAVRFSGWLGPETFALDSAEKQQRSITLTCYDIAERLRQMHGFPLTVEASSGTPGWYRLANVNIDRLTHHYLQWHTNVLSLADFAWSGQGATYPLPRFTTDGETIWEQGDRLARAIAYKLTCNTKGQLHVKGDPMILPTSSQATEFNLPTQRTSTVVTTITEDDYGEHEFDAGIDPATYWLQGSAIDASTSVNQIKSRKAAAPSKTPGQGSTTTSETKQLVTKQAELNARLANRYAARVNPRMGRLRLNMVKTRHVVEPADMEWMRIVLPAAERGKYPDLTETGERYLIEEIRNRYDLEKLRKNTTWICEREFEGAVNDDMTVIDPPKHNKPSSNNGFSNWADDYVAVEPPITPIEAITGLPPIVDEDGQGMIAILNDGTIAVTNDFNTPSYEGGPTWTVYDHSSTLGSAILQFARQANQSDVTGWIVTDAKIFKGDLLQNASPTLTEELDFGYSSNYRAIGADGVFAPGQFAVVASLDSGTVKETRTLDGGATWGGESSFGTAGQEDTSYDFTSGDDLGWAALTNADSDVGGGARPAAAEPAAGSISGSGWVTADYQQANASHVRAIYIHIDLATPFTIQSGETITVTFDYTKGTHDSGLVAWLIATKDSGGTWTTRKLVLGGSTSNGSDLTTVWTATGTLEIHGIAVWIRTDTTSTRTGSALLKSVVVDQNTNPAVPGLYISTEVAGNIYAGLGLPVGETETPIYAATNYSFSYSEDTDIVDDDGLLTGLVARYGLDDTLYYGYRSDGPSSLDAAYDDSNNLFRGDPVNGETDITPVVSSVRYGPDWERSCYTIAVSSDNGDVVAFVGVDLDRSKFGVFVTNSALSDTPEWIQLIAAGAGVDYRRCMFSADASSFICFGDNGAIAYSEDPLNPAALDSRVGDLSTTAEIVGIASF